MFLRLDKNTELAQAVDVMMAQAKIIYNVHFDDQSKTCSPYFYQVEEYPSNSPQFFKSCAMQKHLKDTKHKSLHLEWK